MGLFGKIGDIFNKIDYHTSNDPEIVGKWFEDEVQKLFSTKYLKLLKKRIHSKQTSIDMLKVVKIQILYLNIPQQENDLRLNVNSERN